MCIRDRPRMALAAPGASWPARSAARSSTAPASSLPRSSPLPGPPPCADGWTSPATAVGRRAVLISPGGDTAVRPRVEVKADEPGRYLLTAPPGSHDAVVLSDHDAPYVDEVLRIALASNAFFVGMLGSRQHAPQAVRRLRDAGVLEAHLARLRAPVGLDIGSRTPEEIALSIVAEVIATERGRQGGRMGVDWSEGSAAGERP